MGNDRTNRQQASEHAHSRAREYAGGYIKAWIATFPHGLLVVYAVLFVWASINSYTIGVGWDQAG